MASFHVYENRLCEIAKNVNHEKLCEIAKIVKLLPNQSLSTQIVTLKLELDKRA